VDTVILFLVECFILDQTKTSGLCWRVRPREHFLSQHEWAWWNTKYAGKSVGTNGPRYSRVSIKIGDRRYRFYTHRIVFAITYGRWPDARIDHENRDKSANGIENLREATSGQNKQNTGLRSDNTSGFKGVMWVKGKRKWRAEIGVSGRKIHLGYFTDVLDAVMARLKAERQFHPFRAWARLDSLNTVITPAESAA
jgi:hypothetical protein